MPEITGSRDDFRALRKQALEVLNELDKLQQRREQYLASLTHIATEHHYFRPRVRSSLTSLIRITNTTTTTSPPPLSPVEKSRRHAINNKMTRQAATVDFIKSLLDSPKAITREQFDSRRLLHCKGTLQEVVKMIEQEHQVLERYEVELELRYPYLDEGYYVHEDYAHQAENKQTLSLNHNGKPPLLPRTTSSALIPFHQRRKSGRSSSRSRSRPPSLDLTEFPEANRNSYASILDKLKLHDRALLNKHIPHHNTIIPPHLRKHKHTPSGLSQSIEMSDLANQHDNNPHHHQHHHNNNHNHQIINGKQNNEETANVELYEYTGTTEDDETEVNNKFVFTGHDGWAIVEMEQKEGYQREVWGAVGVFVVFTAFLVWLGIWILTEMIVNAVEISHRVAT